MSDRLNDPLAACIDLLKNRLQRYRGRTVGEQNTKASLIEPLLRSLGWDVDDFEEVHREYKSKRADRPVDYALQLAGKPAVFIEAKGLGENLSDRKWVSQILSYATVAGVVWCVLTDGNEYRFYNATAPVDADEKLFGQVRIADAGSDELHQALGLIARASVENNSLAEHWETHFVDRQVRHVLESVLSGQDARFVKLVRKHLPELTDRQLAKSLARQAITVNGRAVVHASSSSPPGLEAPTRNRAAVKRAGKKKRHAIGVSLQQILESGLLAAPLKLFRKYKGKVMQATLRSDGTVEFDGKSFASCSTAAEFARSTVTGRHMNTNGWQFWQYTDSEGIKRELLQARERYLKAHHQG